jgi:hypothetical protein
MDNDPHMAVIVPEQAWRDYNQGQPLGGDCSLPVAEPRMPYVPFRPADGASLDYPLVRITWDGQADRARDMMIERFAAWLESGRLQGRGYRDAEGRVGDRQPTGVRTEVPVRSLEEDHAKQAIDGYPRARPAVTVAYVMDMSGSMNEPTLERGSRFDRARELVLKATALLGPADFAGLWTFPDSKDRNAVGIKERVRPRPVNDEHRDVLIKYLTNADRPDGGFTPLYNAIAEAAASLAGRGGNQTVIVFSDGFNSVEGMDVAELGRRLGGPRRNLEVIIMAIGEKECDEDDLKKLTGDRVVRAVCHRATSGAAAKVISRLFAEVRSR